MTGTARWSATVGASFAAGSIVLPQYTILTAAGGHSGTFAGVDTLGLPAGFVATLSYDATHVYLNFVLDYRRPRSNLNVNQQNVDNALGEFLQLPMAAFRGAFGRTFSRRPDAGFGRDWRPDRSRRPSMR